MTNRSSRRLFLLVVLFLVSAMAALAQNPAADIDVIESGPVQSGL